MSILARMKDAYVAPLLILMSACSSSSSGPPAKDSGAESAVAFDSGSVEDSDEPTDSEEPADTSTTSGMRCYVTSGSCICLDPAPEGYTATSCPKLPCCWKDLTASPPECACSTFTGDECDSWRSGPAVDSCP